MVMVLSIAGTSKDSIAAVSPLDFQFIDLGRRAQTEVQGQCRSVNNTLRR